VLPPSDTLLYWSIAAAGALSLAFILPRLLGRRASAPRGGHAVRLALIAAAVALPLLGVGLRALPGNPPTPDSGPAAASASADASGNVPVAREELVRHLGRSPRDARAWVLLARMDFEADRYDEAAAAYQKALTASTKVAADAGVWCEYADALGMAQGGMLAGKPRELVMRALALSPAHPKALEMAGSAAYEQREYAAAAAHWRQLLGQLPERSVQYQELATAIDRAERLDLAAGGGQEATR
jgi:cytochrome c-type biogenesis protein CcmH